jgi:putative spermidine/putrescine transport system ATP-binding protein
LTPTVPASVGIRVDALTRKFGNVIAVDAASFEVPAGTFVVLLGPSGSGKTTILRMVAGLEVPSRGRVWLGDVDSSGIPAHKRGVGYVFQRPSMFPNYTVRENIGWGLKLRRRPADEIRQRVAEMVDLVHLNGLEDRYVTQMSGGEAQRVAIARALAPDPPILLLDEPLSALDAKLRDELKDVIAEVQDRTRKTMMMVTHDQREALSLADTVVVLDRGRIAQLGSPSDIYRRPANAFVAGFVGNTNLVSARVVAVLADGSVRVAALGTTIEVPGPADLAVGDQTQLSLRPDDLDVIDERDRDRYRYIFEGRVRDAVFIGDVLRLQVEVAGTVVRVNATGRWRFALMDHRPESIVFATNAAVVIPSPDQRKGEAIRD